MRVFSWKLIVPRIQSNTKFIYGLQFKNRYTYHLLHERRTKIEKTNEEEQQLIFRVDVIFRRDKVLFFVSYINEGFKIYIYFQW